jgi:carbon-monoxide dehydrogenase small subunit
LPNRVLWVKRSPFCGTPALDRCQVGREEEIRHYLSGNLCRCAAYPEIIEAVKLAAQKRRKS